MILLYVLAYLLVGVVLVGTAMHLGKMPYEGGEEILGVLVWPLLIPLLLFVGLIVSIGWALEKISGKPTSNK